MTTPNTYQTKCISCKKEFSYTTKHEYKHIENNKLRIRIKAKCNECKQKHIDKRNEHINKIPIYNELLLYVTLNCKLCGKTFDYPYKECKRYTAKCNNCKKNISILLLIMITL